MRRIERKHTRTCQNHKTAMLRQFKHHRSELCAKYYSCFVLRRRGLMRWKARKIQEHQPHLLDPLMRYGRLLISGSLALIVSLDIDILAVTQNPLYPTSRRHIPVNIKITGIRAPKLISIGKCYDPVRLVKEDHFNQLSASTVWFLRMIHFQRYQSICSKMSNFFI